MTSASGQKSGVAIVLVEDDAALAHSISRILESAGYRVYAVENASDATRLMKDIQPKLILLDLNLPDADGLVFLSSLRATNGAPVIICSGRQEQANRVLGLRLGADDFLPKPFDVDELEARVAAVLRRASPARDSRSDQTRVELADLVVVPSRGTVTLGGHPVRLTPTEFRMLLVLARSEGSTVSRPALLSDVWGFEDMTGAEHIIDVHLGRLRAKLRRACPTSPIQIETVRGKGFRVVAAGVVP